MYQDRPSWLARSAAPRGLRSARRRSQAVAWSSEGPHIEVNEATRPASRGVLTASQHCIEPQS